MVDRTVTADCLIQPILPQAALPKIALPEQEPPAPDPPGAHRSERPEVLDRGGQFGPCRPLLDRFEADPAPVAALLEDREHGREVDLPGAEDHGPTSAGERPGHGVGGMHGGDVPRQPGRRGGRVVAVNDKRAGDEIAAQRSVGQRGEQPRQVVGTAAARLDAERGPDPLSPGADVGEHVHEQPPLRSGRLGRNVADVVEHDPGTEGVGQLERLLRGRDPPLEPLGIGVAAARAKAHGTDDDPLVAEPLADLAQAGLGQLAGVEAASGIELDAADAEVAGPAQGRAQITGQRRGRDRESGSVHRNRVPRECERGRETSPPDGILSTMPTLAEVTDELERLAPLRLAADWDTVGLLIGGRRPRIERVMTCLTLTERVAAEAVAERADLVVVHHPLPFRPLGRITTATGTGRVLLALIESGVSLWSPHTAWDSAAGGINDQLAAILDLERVVPLEPAADLPLAGFGRAGTAARDTSVADLARRAAARLGARGVQIAGDETRPAGRVGIICGSGGDGIEQVRRAGCDTLLTGEIRLHHAVEAEAAGLAVIAVGHHASESFSLPVLARRLAAAVPGLTCWASRQERDPLAWLGG